jgi:glycosyltransferase involved in cell wall biosynthesis
MLHADRAFASRAATGGAGPNDMRVCLDLSVLRIRPTGVGYYGYFLGKALVENFAEADDYLVFDGLRFAGLRGFIDAHPRQSEMKVGLYQSLWNATAAYPVLRSAWRRVKGAAFSRGTPQHDVVHAIAYAPPLRPATAWLPLIHDLSHLRFPQFHPTERVRWLKAHDAALGEAVLVNTVSEFTKREIVALLGVAPERVRVTYPGVNPAFSEAGSDDASVLARYGVTAGRFLLNVASIDPRKNLTTVAAAFARLPQSLRRDAPLIFVGQPGWRRVEFPQSVARLQERGEIRFVGYVPVADLRVLYRNTALFLYPSHYEGFGIPVVEAHLTGAPVAITEGGGAREAGCGLALEVPADDLDRWTAVMTEALAGQTWQDENGRAARAAAAGAFTWQRNARQTKKIYDEIALVLSSQHRAQASER